MVYSQSPIVDGAGLRISDKVTLSFTGTVLNLNNITSGDAAALITERNTMINALSGNNREFKLLHNIGSTSVAGTPIISGIYPKVEGLSFDAGTWNNQIPYSFDLVYETNYVSGAVPVEDYSDAWDFSEDEGTRTIRASHAVSAKGINTAISGAASTALDNAKTWVNARMGISTLPAGYPAWAQSGFTSNQKFQKYRTEAISTTAGTFAATEDIVLASGNFAHSWTAQLQKDSDGITTLSLNGNIEGLGRWDVATDMAVSGWNVNVSPILAGLANEIYIEMSGLGTLNTSKVQSLSVTKDEFNGRVGYSVSYNDDPTDNLPSGIAEFDINKQIKLPIRSKAVFAIPGRAQGSILHDIGTPTDGAITIAGTAKGVLTTQLDYVKTFCEDEANLLRPNFAQYNQLWLTDFSKTENEDQKSFSFSIAWAYTDNLTSVQSPSGIISF
jgi:hypothetical protein